MNIVDVKTKVDKLISNEKLILSAQNNTLNSPSIDSLTNIYFANTLSGTLQRVNGDTAIIENGQLTYRLHLDTQNFSLYKSIAVIEATITFFIANTGIQLTIAAFLPQDYRFSDSFSELSNIPTLPINQLSLQDSWFSIQSEEVSVALFNAKLQARGPLQTIAWMVGDVLQLSGTLHRETVDNKQFPIMALHAKVLNPFSLGIFTLSITVRLRSAIHLLVNSTPAYLFVSHVEVITNFIASDLTIPVVMPLYGEGQYLLSFYLDVAQPKPTLSSLHDLSGFTAGNDPKDLLNPELSLEKATFSLDSLSIVLDPVGRQLINMQVGVGLNIDWIIIPHTLEIEKIGALLSINNPTHPQKENISISLLAQLRIGSVLLDTSILLPDRLLQAQLADGDTINVNDVMNLFGKGVALPGNDPLSIYQLVVYAQVHKGQEAYSLEAAASGTLTLMQGLVIDTIFFSIAYQDKALSVVTLGSMLTLTQIGVALFLQGTYHKENGWQFEGSTGQGQQIPLGKLIEDLANIFGDISFPSSIADLTIQDLGISFNTKTKDFTFTCESLFPIDDQKVAITLTIDVTQHLDAKTQQPDGSFTKHFRGHITIGAFQFDLTFDSDTTSKTFIAAYHKEAGDTIRLKELIGSVSSTVADFIPQSLQVTLKDALFAYSKAGQVSTFLFAFDIGTSVSLSNLPLVGQELPPNQTLGVEKLQLLVLSQSLKQERVTNLNNLILQSGLGTLPVRDLEQGFSFSAIAVVGGVKQPLSLSLQSQQSAGTNSGLQEERKGTPAPSVSPSASSSSPSITWISIQRSLGPLYFEKIGFRLSEVGLSILLNALVSLTELNITLEGLAATVPLHQPSLPQFSLQGLGIAYQGGPIEVSGELVQVQKNGIVEYEGTAFLAAKGFTISALGSYTTVNERPSLFVFALLDKPLGGPAFFYVTGLAAGFGYNRTLLLPDQNSVPQFPLVAGVDNPAALGGQQQPDHSWKMPDPATALSALADVVQPMDGVYWFAAGVRFTSFDLLHSTALLVVALGNELEIAVLGLSWISLPPPALPDAAAPVSKYAYGELGIEIKVLPSQGILTATAILTPNSFVIDPACKLTGGFAFSVWFGDHPHAGEFVLTLGGYHPNFEVPSYYPTVPRLGFNWPVSDDVTISGNAYFALTPSAVMAGGGLQVLFSSGDLRAWFKAQMDALIAWAPFHYIIDISVSIGASYRLSLLFVTVTLKVELGAELTIWGPPMGGKAHVDWYVISFTIYFGADQGDRPMPLQWTNESGTGFAQTLLPHQTPGADKSRAARTSHAVIPIGGDAPTASQSNGICAISANDGLLQTITNKDNNPVWIVRPNHFIFSTLTAIPATQIDITSIANEASTTIAAQKVSPDGATYYVCIRPMKATLTSSVFTVTLRDDDDGRISDLASLFDYDIALSNVPTAKWGRPLADNEEPEENALLAGRMLGLKNITPKLSSLTPDPNGDDALHIDIATAFNYDVVDEQNPKHLPLEPGALPADAIPHRDSTALSHIQASLMEPNTVGARNAIFATLQAYGIDPHTNGSLNTLATKPAAYLTGNPLLDTASVSKTVGGA